MQCEGKDFKMAAGRKKSAEKHVFFSSRALCKCFAVFPAVILAVIYGVSRIAALTSPDGIPVQETLFSILTLDFLNLLPDRTELWNSLCQQTREQLRTFSENPNVQICLVGYVSAVFLILAMSLIKKLQVILTKRKPKRGRPRKIVESGPGSCGVVSWYRTGVACILVLSVFSLGWEWVRMYQIEVAKKAATVHVGLPAECSTDSIGAWTSIKSWMRWHLSWSHDPCEKYHHALLVDPFWEVNPLMVLTATATRCIIRPIELISAGTGTSLRLLFQEIPSPWQPVVMATVVMATVLALTMACRYRVRVPLFFSLEPSTTNRVEKPHPPTTTDAMEDTKPWTLAKPTQGNNQEIKDRRYGHHLKLLDRFSTPKKSLEGERSPYTHLQGSPSGNGAYNGVKSFAATM